NRDDSRGRERKPRNKDRNKERSKPRKNRDSARSDTRLEGMERYRLEVGHKHEVKPGNIVGAIANEAGLESKHIGRIDIHDDFSVVDLPSGMPKDIFNTLKKTWVSGTQLKISILDSSSELIDSKNSAARKLKAKNKLKSKSRSKPKNKDGVKRKRKAKVN
ncbi:MAG: DbpA RNA binding domain-containing protein, partial [Gammaproteobacteria bacterium]|nr:DbpA RNA binding domain-containing protein [Gammaproteobacteria bacterium]